jgi:hypothetical protein
MTDAMKKSVSTKGLILNRTLAAQTSSVALFPCTISPQSNRRKVFGNERALIVCSWHEDKNPSVIAHGEKQAMLYTHMPSISPASTRIRASKLTKVSREDKSTKMSIN